MNEVRIPMHGSGQTLYVAHEKVYPREIDGRFARLRVLSVWVLLGIFYLLPWLNWNGRQGVLFDLPARTFFFTAVGGRLWCGYACPQTVWTESFMWMERFAEGDRNARVKLDRAPWSAHKLARKSLKQFMWITFALWTGFTFVGYFTPIRTLADGVMAWTLGPWEMFWI